jgi:Tfp pilus assembly protein PilX
MNTKFKLSWLRYLSTRANRGFALPMVMMVGLVIAVVGATVVMMGMEDNNKVVSQKAKATSMAAAEAGLVRVQNMFAGARFAALYNHSDWSTAILANGTPNSLTALGQTMNAQLEQTANTTSTACSNVTPATKTITIKSQLSELRGLAVASSSTFAPLDSKNSYRLVSYQYNATSGQMPAGTAVGRLVIEGRYVPDPSQPDQNISLSRLMVDIPISGTANALVASSGSVPGLWIKEEGVANGSANDVDVSNGQASKLGNQSYAANVLFNDCGTTSVINQTYLDTLNGSSNMEGSYVAEKSSMSIPSIPAKPTIPVENTLSGISDTLTLPEAGDSQNNGVYYYQVNGNIDLNGSKKLTITPGNKVVIYLNGNITKGTSIEHDCTGVSGCDPTDFQIYGEKASGGELCMNGNNKTSAFILAPTYAAGSTGGANFAGSLWVKTWGKLSDCSASGNHTAVTQTQTWVDIPPSLQPTPMALPIVAAFSGWQQIDSSLAANAIPAPPAYTGSYVSTTPTTTPTITPTINPTITPTINPTIAPTTTPTIAPTINPTIAPTTTPTIVPTTTPTITPTTTPTIVPTTTPTIRPTTTPTPKPSDFTTKKDCQDAGFTWDNPVGQDKPVCQ